MNDTIRTQIEALDSMRLPDLQARFAEVLGGETRCPNKRFLVRKITEALETGADDGPANDEGDAGEAAADTATETTQADDGTSGEPRLTKLSVEELQAKYLEVVGRTTGSANKRYLVWKIRQAQKGRIPVGPRGTRRADGEAPDFKVLPLRMEAELVTQLDEARERLGMKSRMDLFRRSLHAFLLEAGEVRVAEMFAPEA